MEPSHQHKIPINPEPVESNKEDGKEFQTNLETEALTDGKSTFNDYSQDNTRNSNQSHIAHSGNSEVDIKIQIDSSSIAFAILYSLFALNQLSSEGLELALSRLKKFNED